MIGKISKGNGFGGVLDYLLDPDKRPRIISSSLATTTKHEMAREFRMISNLNRRIGKPVRHFSVAFAPEDGAVDDVIKEAITLKMLDAMGYGDCQYIAIDHHRDDPGHDLDHDHDHIHILTNAVNLDGKRVHDNWDVYKLQNVLRDIEQEFGLRQILSSWEVKQANIQAVRAKATDSNLELFTSIQQSIAKPTGLQNWIELLAHQQIDIRFNLTHKGTVKGVTFIHNGAAYKGSDMGASWQKVSAALIPSDRDLALMQATNLHAQERQVKLDPHISKLFERVAELAQMKLGGRKKFESGRIKIKTDGDNLSVYRVRPNKLVLKATRSESGWQPDGFPDVDLRDVQLLERLNKIEPQISAERVAETRSQPEPNKPIDPRFKNLEFVDNTAYISDDEDELDRSELSL